MIGQEMRQKLRTFGIETIKVGVLLAIAEESEEPTAEEVELLSEFRNKLRPLFSSDHLGRVAILKKENAQWTFRRASWSDAKWSPMRCSLEKTLELVEMTTRMS